MGEIHHYLKSIISKILAVPLNIPSASSIVTGHGGQLFISQGVMFKTALSKYGGGGHAKLWEVTASLLELFLSKVF